MSKDDRAKLYPRCGKLNPDGLAALARAEDYDQVKAVAEYYAEYSKLFEGAGNNPGDKTLEDKFFEHEVCFFFNLHKNYLLKHFFPGAFECERILATIPLWSILLLLEAERTGVPQYRVDLRMRCAEAPRQDRQLHSNLLSTIREIHTHTETKQM